ncbi:hypothetical protein DCAR_0208929 [Daucus carota subsp. sativus]|uniref:Uncharacterized protein n=1 Tax=Daucus carota subsp. sativus TaxID=79200 RepID=A0A166EWI5_DAUCS|nr:hypothetical protein DCAR_0208929 [Daucus carota subsp. sativus]
MSCEEASSKQGGGDVMDPVPSGTKLTYQAVEPMSRVHDNATANVAANVYTGAGEQVKTTTRGGGNSSKCCCCCVGLCRCCTACYVGLFYIPCLGVTMVLNCLCCPVNIAIGRCCPSGTEPIHFRVEDFKSCTSMFC